MQNEMLNTPEAAKKLRLSPGTLEVWRHLGKGPKYRKIGRKVYYTTQDIQDFIDHSEIKTIDSY